MRWKFAVWPKFAIDVVGGLLMLDCLWLVLSGWGIRRFLRSTPRLDSVDDLLRLQRLVTRCSYCNILFAITLILTFGVFMVSIFSGMARPEEFDRLFQIGFVRIAVMGYFAEDLESKLEHLPAASDALREAHAEIMRKWGRGVGKLGVTTS